MRKLSAQNTVTRDIRSQALEYYLENHVITPTILEVDICGSLSACLVAWQNGHNTSTMVDLALSSMALAVYARIRSAPQAAAEAYTNYHQLLKLVQEDIARPTLDSKSIDACLLTVFLMGRYESTVHQAEGLNLESEFKRINSWSHHDGALALLKLWHMHLRNEVASTVVKQTRRGLLKSLLLRSRPVPEWLQDGSCFGERGPGLRYDRILARLVNLRSVMNMQQDLTDESYRDDLIAEAAQLACDLRIFTTELPGSYLYYHDATPPSDQDWLQGAVLNICLTPEHATIWAHLFATRLIVTYTNIQILQSLPQTKEEVESYVLLLQAAADDLVATIPQCLGLVFVEDERVEVLTQDILKPWQVSRAVWPLTIAVSVSGYSEALRQRFQTQLASIGKMIGDGALQTVTTEEWPSI